MEQLAALVLNGKGLQLIGQTSSSPEIQAFLDNVSAYMVRIHKWKQLVHRVINNLEFKSRIKFGECI